MKIKCATTFFNDFFFLLISVVFFQHSHLCLACLFDLWIHSFECWFRSCWWSCYWGFCIWKCLYNISWVAVYVGNGSHENEAFQEEALQLVSGGLEKKLSSILEDLLSSKPPEHMVCWMVIWIWLWSLLYNWCLQFFYYQFPIHLVVFVPTK